MSKDREKEEKRILPRRNPPEQAVNELQDPSARDRRKSVYMEAKNNVHAMLDGSHAGLTIGSPEKLQIR